MVFHGAQATDARFGNFNENHPGSSQINNIVYNIGPGKELPITALSACSSVADISHSTLLYVEGGERETTSSTVRFESRDPQGCLEGTRREILGDVDCWINSKRPITRSTHG
jgi:hypothetical protein